MKIKTIGILLAVFAAAFLLRVLFLKDLSLTFGYDQARDAYVSQQIIGGDLKVLGPPASTPGLYHGVFYYYLLAPAYFLGNGSPVVAAYWIAFLNSLTVFVVFYLTYLLTKKNLVASFFAAILFMVSFEASQYATWLSNPTTSVLTVPLFYLGLWIWLSKTPRSPQRSRKGEVGVAPFLAALGLGLSIQSEIFLAYHLVPLAIWAWVARKNITKKQLLVFVFTLTLTLASMILAEVKFGFKGISGIKALLIAQEPNLAYAKSLGDYLVLYLNQIGRIFSFNAYPGNIGYGGGFVVALILVSIVKSKKFVLTPGLFLVTWLLSHLAVVTVGGISTPFLMVGIGPAVSILLAIWLGRWWSQGRKVLSVLILLILIFGNLSMIARENPRGSTLFAIQKDMLLSKQLAAIDFTYQEAGGKPFSLNSLTSPLWINIVWSYLYKWYGLPKYGYLPSWHGRDQIGQLDSLPRVVKPDELSFLILEPMEGIPAQYLDLTLGEEDVKSKLVSEKSFGELRVQKRNRKGQGN